MTESGINQTGTRPRALSATLVGVIVFSILLMTFQRLKPKIDEFNALYRDVKTGDRYALTYVPGKGTTLLWNGQPLGTVADEDGRMGSFWHMGFVIRICTSPR